MKIALMSRLGPYAILTALCIFPLTTVAAQEPVTGNGDRVDCRYEGNGRANVENTGSTPIEPFPENDVFRPLLADPKQPRFFATWQATRVRTNNTSVNIASVGLGDNIGLLGRRNGCNGWLGGRSASSAACLRSSIRRP